MSRMEAAVGEEGQTGRRPFRWEIARPLIEDTLRSGGLLVERLVSVKDERELKRWRSPFEWVSGGRA